MATKFRTRVSPVPNSDPEVLELTEEQIEQILDAMRSDLEVYQDLKAYAEKIRTWRLEAQPARTLAASQDRIKAVIKNLTDFRYVRFLDAITLEFLQTRRPFFRCNPKCAWRHLRSLLHHRMPQLLQSSRI